jgi:hypothetical protein
MGDKEPRIFLMAVKVFFPRKERQHWILFLESEKWFYFQFQWELTTVRRNFQYRLYWAKSDRPASTASHDFLGRPTLPTQRFIFYELIVIS